MCTQTSGKAKIRVGLDLEAQAVIIDDLVVGLLEVTAEQVHVGDGARLCVGLGDDHHIERLGKILVQHLDLINAGINISVDVDFHQILIWDVSAEKASRHLSASGALPAGQV